MLQQWKPTGWNLDRHTDRCHVLRQSLRSLGSRHSYLCRTPKYINVSLLGSCLIGHIDIWQGLEGHPAGLSKGLKDNSEQVLLDGLSSDLSHDGALSSQVLVTKAQEVVDHKRCGVKRK